MKFIVDFGKGILIGAGCILPGISSGVLCVVFGLYEKLLDSILNFFSDIKKNSKFLLPIVLGAILGIILFSKILQFLLYKYPLQTKSIFIGLILGGVVLLVKDINRKEKFCIKKFIYLIISLSIGFLMVYLENKIGIKNVENVNYIYLIFSGILMSIGIVVPGVSSTIILMLLGIYSLYLNSVSTLYLPVIIPIAIGVIIGSLIFMSIIKILLNKFYIQTMFSIIGFTIGSIFVLLPDINTSMEIIVMIICIVCGYYSMNILNK